MSRSLSTNITTEINKTELSPIILVELNFQSGYVRVWNGIGPITANGETWQGVGDLGNISTIEETVETIAKGVDITLNGIPSELIAIALGEYYQGRACNIYLGFVNSSGDVIDNILLGGYYMDVMILDDVIDQASITIKAESKLRRLTEASNRRYTDRDQNIDYPGDTGFQYVPGLQDKIIVW